MDTGFDKENNILMLRVVVMSHAVNPSTKTRPTMLCTEATLMACASISTAAKKSGVALGRNEADR